MTRKQLIRLGTLTMFSAALGKYDALAQNEKGVLSIDLGQWKGLVFELEGNIISVPVADVFAALAEEFPVIRKGKR